MKAKRGKCLALAAVLAMVVCAFAVAMPAGDSDATAISAEAEIEDATSVSTATDIGGSATSYVVTADVALKIVSTGTVTLYVVDGKTITITGTDQNSSGITIYAANAEGTKCLTDDNKLVVSGTFAGSVNVKATYGSYSGSAAVGSTLEVWSDDAITTGTLAGTATTDNSDNGAIQVPAGETLSGPDASFTGIACAAKVINASGAVLNGTAPEEVSLMSNSDSVVVYSGSLTVTDGNTPSTGTVVLKDIVSATGITFRYSSGMTISGGNAADEGTLTMSAGKVAGTTSFPATGISAYGASSKLGATLYDVGAAGKAGSTVLTGAVSIYGTKTIDIQVDSEEKIINLMNGAILIGAISTKNASGSYDEIVSGTFYYDSTSYKAIKVNQGTPAVTLVAGIGITEAEISGTVNLEGAFVLNADESITFGNNGKLVGSSTVTILGTVDGEKGDADKITGTVYTTAENLAYLKQYAASAEVIGTKAVTTAAELYKAIMGGYKEITMTMAAEQTLSKENAKANVLSAEGVTLTIGGNFTLNIGSESSRFSLDLTKCTIQKAAASGTTNIVVNKGSSLSIDESNLYIAVDVKEGASVESVNNTATYDNIAGTVDVGFGATLYVSGKLTAGTVATVYGTLIVPEGKTLIVPATASIATVKGADVQVLGAIELAGTLTMDEKTTMTVDGSVSVANVNGAAVFDNSGKVTVDGSFSVSAPNQNMPANELKAGTGGFVVNGTLAMNGKLSGTVSDKGSVAINGTSSDATVVIFDGVSLTVTSVSGKLTVSDDGIMDEKYADSTTSSGYKANVTVYDGNSVELTNVNGVVVSEAVSDTVYNGARTVACNMYLSGTVTRSDKTSPDSTGQNIVVEANAEDYTTAKVHTDGNLALGEGIGMTVSAGTFDVGADGTVSAVAKYSQIANVSGSTVTVSGEIKCTNGNSDFKGTVNAASYSITDSTTAVKTVYYTSIDSAMAEIDGADSKTVTQIGKVTLNEDATVAAGQKLAVNGTLTIAKDKTLTVEKDGKVSGQYVVVKGIFAIENYASDVQLKGITADIVSKEDPARTYTSLASAIALGMTNITLNNNADITSDLTIPEGTTVSSDYTVSIRENTVLTVDGELKISSKGDLNNDKSSSAKSTDTAGKLVVNGEVSVVIDDIKSYPSMFDSVSGAFFVKENGAVMTLYVTNLANAVESMDATVMDGTIGVQGTVVCNEDLVLTKPESLDSCYIGFIGTETDKTSVSVSSITLDGAGMAVKEYATFTGTVYADCADGTAAVELKKASMISLVSGTETGVSSETDYLYIAGVPEGQVAITQGTVTVDTALVVGSDDTDNTSKLTVDSGAVLAVPEGAVLCAGYTGSISTKAQTAAVVIDGTLDVTKGAVLVYGLQINGTMKVANSKAVSIPYDGETYDLTGVIVAGELEINGTVDISSTEGKEGVVTVADDAQALVGSKPGSLGAEAAVTGAIIVLDDGMVKVYSGSVEEVTDGVDALEPTAFFINGTKYFEVYSETATIGSVVTGEDIDLAGLTTPDDAEFKYYSDEAMKNVLSSSTAIGVYSGVYMKFDASEVKGTVTAGAGLRVYIDGVYTSGSAPVSLTVGTHTVTFEVTAGYDGKDVKIQFNGQTVQNGSFTITADMDSYVLTVTGATASTVVQPEKDDGMGVTDYLLIVLVVLIAIMAVMVALRLMRN